MSSTTTEQTENVRQMLKFLSDNATAAVTNNVAHATVTTNAWRDAVDMIPKTVGSLETLLLQLGGSAGPIMARTDGAGVVARALGQLTPMKLVFDSATRQQLLQKAVKALQNLQVAIGKLPAGGGGQFNAPGAGQPVGSSASSSSAGLSGAALLNSPMPTIERATVVFDPERMKTGGGGTSSTASGFGPDGEPLSRNIKPSNFMTFSSAESSASARMGVPGKCATCGAHRDVGSAFCTSCGKNSNIVFE